MTGPLDPTSTEAAGTASLILLGLFAAAVELLIGIALGWWLRGGKRTARSTADDIDHAQHALTNLHELAQRVQADVGAHSSQVEAISNQLSAQQSDGAEQEVNVLEAVTKILEVNQRLEQQLQSAESKLHEQAEQIKLHSANALTDALTGLGNRRAFDAELARRSAEFQRQGTTFCLLMLDVDHFKKFNDAHGHLAGDEVLRLVGRTLKSAVRTPDFVARYGGEEFGVIMPQTTLAETPPCGERIRAAIEQAECEFEGKKLRVTASIGIAQVLSAAIAERFGAERRRSVVRRQARGAQSGAIGGRDHRPCARQRRSFARGTGDRTHRVCASGSAPRFIGNAEFARRAPHGYANRTAESDRVLR